MEKALAVASKLNTPLSQKGVYNNVINTLNPRKTQGFDYSWEYYYPGKKNKKMGGDGLGINMG